MQGLTSLHMQYDGQKGVELAINLLYDEFVTAMALSGYVTTQNFKYSFSHTGEGAKTSMKSSQNSFPLCHKTGNSPNCSCSNTLKEQWQRKQTLDDIFKQVRQREDLERSNNRPDWTIQVPSTCVSTWRAFWRHF